MLTEWERIVAIVCPVLWLLVAWVGYRLDERRYDDEDN